jgi:hypothetical protein
LKCFFSGDRRLDREQVLTALKGTLESVVGSPVRLHDARFLDLPLADFFASDPSGRLFAVRWIEARELAARFFEMLAGYARLQTSGRPALAQALGLPQNFPSLTLILVSDTVGDAWAEVATTLNIPLVGLRVHPLLDGAGQFAGCYFETRFAPGDAAWGSGSAVLEPVREREPHGAAAAAQPGSIAPTDPAGASDASPRVRAEPPPQDFEEPSSLLTDEEAASFRLLESVLAETH